MSSETFTTFLEQLKESHLLDDQQWVKLYRRPEAVARDERGLANYLCHKGWLTPFQVQELGKGRGQRLLVGPYRLLDKIGEGGMGQVYKAHHQVMNRVVAFKVIADDRVKDPRRVQRFYQEIRLTAQLAHPNIVTAYDAGKLDETHYFAMEFVEGTDLSRLVQEKGPLPVAEACEFVRQAALGLEHAHAQGLVHRDIKPSNLIVTKVAPGKVGAGRPVVKILDMGLARLQCGNEDGPELTRDGMVVGSPAYLAPEQGRNPHNIDARADLYSLGCTLYFLLTGHPPFAGPSSLVIMVKHQTQQPASVQAERPEVPAALDAVMMKLLAKDPGGRYATARQVAEALAPFTKPSRTAKAAPSGAMSGAKARAASTIGARSWRLRPVGAPGQGARPWLAIAGIGAALVVVGLIVLILSLPNGETPSAHAQTPEKPPTTLSVPSAAPPLGAAALYQAMKLSDLQLIQERYRAGDTVRFNIRFVNTSGRDVPALRVERGPGKHHIGTVQFWIERLGEEDIIPCLSGHLAKRGRKYAAGEIPVPSSARIGPGEEVVLSREVKTVYPPGKPNAEPFPPGRYRYYLDYPAGDGVGVVQTSDVEFDLRR